MSKKKHSDGSPMPGDWSVGDTTTAAGNGQKAPPLTPRERFVKHVQRRRDAVVKALKRLANLANRQSYAYTDAERDQILQSVDDAHKLMRARFLQTEKAAAEGGFRFDDWGAAGGAAQA